MSGSFRGRSLAILCCLALAACGKIVDATGDGGGGDDDDDADAGDGGSTIDSGPGDPCSGSVTLDNLTHCIELAYCDVIARCSGFGIGDTACEDLPFEFLDVIDLRSARARLGALIDAGKVTYHADRVGPCLADIRTTSCRGVEGSGGVFARCEIVTGNAEDDEPCAYALECGVPNARCVGDAVDPPGPQIACTGKVCDDPVPTGQDCAAVPCSPGDHCVFDGAAQTCLKGDLNSACSSDTDCDPDFQCANVDPSIPASGDCTPAKGADEACTREGECTLDLRCIGDRVTPAAGKCQAPGGEGATCETDEGGLLGNTCADGFYCSQPDSAVLGTCKPSPTEGGACGTDNFCGLFMACTDDVCQSHGDLGTACSGDDPCNIGLVCSAGRTGAPTGTCIVAVANGELCRSEEHCASGYCNCTRDANGNCSDNGVCADFPACE